MKLPWPVSLLPNVNTAISSVHFSCSVMSNYLWPNGLHDARLPCSSPTPRTCSKSCPSSWWCHPTISSFVVSSSSWLQSYSATGSFLMSQFFASGDQSMGASASASVFSMNIQDFFPLELSDLISLSPRDSQESLHHSSKASILWCSAFFIVLLTSMLGPYHFCPVLCPSLHEKFPCYL